VSDYSSVDIVYTQHGVLVSGKFEYKGLGLFDTASNTSTTCTTTLEYYLQRSMRKTSYLYTLN